jgi:pyruvate,water dikinase
MNGLSGLLGLDEVLEGIRLGDNVVWQVDTLEDYRSFAKPFAEEAVAQGRRLVYLRFAPHEPVLEPLSGAQIIELDPSPGFDCFTREVHQIIETQGRQAFYVFDNLSALALEWATDELLANFFQATCPFLFELDTVA